jgi:2-amino-4-hydroxy-6-hydroxymethyldihydropteridine diphosphokinase
MVRVFFSLGSNQGNRLDSLLSAAKQIDKQIGKLFGFSAVIESEPWGFKADTTFYNQVLMVETEFTPQQLLASVLDIEKTLGRIRSGTKYRSRAIDIDILLYGTEIIESENLVIPHPMLHLRRFVLEPLASIAPDLIHPGFHKTISFLLSQLIDDSFTRIAVEKDAFAKLLNTINQS